MRILVVEDEKPLASSIKKGLDRAGFATDLAHTGVDGLWLASEHDYDAIVLDLMLPELNGFRVCDRLRRTGEWAPVLVLTAKDGELDETEALDTGADDFLRKPFSHDVLVARLRALIRRGRPARPVQLTAGDLRLDRSRRRCWRGEAEIELTAREFSILEYMLVRAGDVISKSDFLEHVWDGDFDGDPNIVEVYIHHLRVKIDQPYDRAAIVTVRGSGYRLMESGG